MISTRQILARARPKAPSHVNFFVARVVVASDAAAVLLFRNARAPTPEPTEADDLVIRRIRDALALIDVRVCDYLLIGTDSEYSFAEAGRL